MAISVKDIQEKEFSTVTENGYDMEQVDDFLDELAEQLGDMFRTNKALSDQVKQLQDSLAAAQAANAEMEKKLPDYNETGYFKNLESAMRESLIGAQRIADETVTEANRKAEQTVAEADANAKTITENAQQTVDGLTAEAERLRGVIDGYKANFKKLVEEQLAALNAEA